MQHQFVLEKMNICLMPALLKLGSALLELSSIWAGFCHLTSFRSLGLQFMSMSSILKPEKSNPV